MPSPPPPHPLLLGSALLTWAVVGVQRLAELPPGAGLAEPAVLLWGGAFLSFGAAFCLNVLGQGRRAFFLLGVQSVAALMVIALGDTGYEGALLAIVSGQAPLYLPSPRYAFGWCAGLVLVSVGEYLVLLPPLTAWSTGVSYAGFLGFTATAAHLQQREREARRELARLHARLEEAQAQLAEREREQERLRIARELHDSLGHHLTALSLNLEASSHTVQGPGLESLRRAQGVARTLLREVREVVSALREESLPLGPALRALVREVPGLAVHLRVADGLCVTEPAAAHCLLRCVQEVITNTLRHAAARHLWIDVVDTGQGALRLHARDDGRGALAIEPGAGLTGMRERFTQLGGSVELRRAAQGGVELTAWLPARGVHG